MAHRKLVKILTYFLKNEKWYNLFLTTIKEEKDTKYEVRKCLHRTISEAHKTKLFNCEYFIFLNLFTRKFIDENVLPN